VAFAYPRQNERRCNGLDKWNNAQHLSCGKHPTQKPLSILTRLILASTKPNAWILDPFSGSSTTGISANLLNRRFLGIDREVNFLEISKNRKLEINNPSIVETYKAKIAGFIKNTQLSTFLQNEIDDSELDKFGE